MLDPLKDGMVRRMRADLKSGTLQPFEREMFAALTLMGLGVQDAFVYAHIFCPTN